MFKSKYWTRRELVVETLKGAGAGLMIALVSGLIATILVNILKSSVNCN